MLAIEQEAAATLDFEVSDPQGDVLELDTRYQAFIAGIGSGKTYLGVIWSLLRALERPGMTGLVAAADYPMLRDVILPIWEEVVPEEFIANFNRADMICEFTNGSRILFRSFDTERKINLRRGLNVNWAWIDEAAYLPRYAFEVIKGRLRQGTDQRCLVTTTPKGYNWIYDVFIRDAELVEDGIAYKRGRAAVFGVATDTNPFLPQDYIRDLKESYTGEFLKQEFYAQFVKFQGLIYSEFEYDVHVVSRDVLEVMVETVGVKRWLYGYDSGFTNPRVMLKIAQLNDGTYIVVREFYRARARLSSSIPVFRELMGADQGVVFADPSAKGEIEELKHNEFVVRGAFNDVSMGIQRVKGLLDKRELLVSEECVMTIAEFNSYRWDEDRDKPIKEMDHAMDAVRYGVATKENTAGIVRANIWDREPKRDVSEETMREHLGLALEALGESATDGEVLRYIRRRWPRSGFRYEKDVHEFRQE